MSKSKVVGIKIDQKKGRGGNPKATIVVGDSKRKHSNLKVLKEG